MTIKIVYHSMTGNTKRIAQAIEKVAKVSAEEITGGYKLSEAVDLLFIGDGIYAGKMNKNTEAFIQSLDASSVKNAAVFGTNGGQDKVIRDMVSLLKERGIHVCEETFVCKGKAWLIANRNHPDQTDIENATRFGERVIASITSEKM